MPPENENTSPDPKPGEFSEDELRKILGDEYEAVVGGGPAGPGGAGVDGASLEAGHLEQQMVGDGAVDPSAGGVAGSGAAGMPGATGLDGAGLPDAESEGPEGEVQPLLFGQLEGNDERRQSSIDLLLDVKLPISVELGRTDMLVKEILECGPGTVIELHKLAGEPVDVFVNGRMVAQGEVVVVDEHFGVRVTNLLSPRDRVRSLA